MSHIVEQSKSPFTYLKCIQPVAFLFATKCYDYVSLKNYYRHYYVDDKREKIMFAHHKQFFIVSFEKSRVCTRANWIMPEWGHRSIDIYLSHLSIDQRASYATKMITF